MSARLRYLRSYVRRCQARLRLATWQIRVVEGELSDADAQIELLTPVRHAATLTVSSQLWGRRPAEIRQTIAHELIHCHTQPPLDVLDQLDVQVEARKIAGDAIELATDELAWIVAGTLPAWKGPR